MRPLCQNNLQSPPLLHACSDNALSIDKEIETVAAGQQSNARRRKNVWALIKDVETVAVR